MHPCNHAMFSGLLFAVASSSSFAGVCCLDDGTCLEVADAPACLALEGDYAGDGTTCAAWVCPQTVPAAYDCWFDASTCEEGTSVMVLGGTSPNPPIPAGFFGPGSDPFSGTIVLKRGPTDNVDHRLHPLAMAPCGTTDIEMVQISLQACEPITVTFNGGQDPQPWDIFEIDMWAPSAGQFTACKTHADGGRFSASMTWYLRYRLRPAGGGEERQYEAPPVELAAEDEPFVLGDTCESLPLSDVNLCAGYDLAPAGGACCDMFCMSNPVDPRNRVCLLPSPGRSCAPCAGSGEEVPGGEPLHALTLAVLTALAGAGVIGRRFRRTVAPG